MTNHALTRNTGKVFLKAGQTYEIMVRYFEQTGSAQLELFWQYGANPEVIIPSIHLRAVVSSSGVTLPPATGTGFQATYFKNEDFTGETVSQIEPAINHNWGSAAPVTGIGSYGPWSATWTGQLQAPLSDTYTITTSSTGCLLVYLDGKLVIDRSTRHTGLISAVNIPLVGGKAYQLVVKFSSFGKSANLMLWWSCAGMAPQFMPGDRVAPPAPDVTPFLVTGSASSRVNPAWIAGSVNSTTAQVTATVNDSAVPVARDSKNNWYLDAAGAGQPVGVPLVPWKAASVRVTANGQTQTRSISWDATDLGQTYGIDPTVIRVGDSLLLTNTTAGQTFEVDTNYIPAAGFKTTITGASGQQVPVRFTQSGSYQVQSRVDGKLAGKINLHVVSADLKGPIACEINYQRVKDVGTTHPSFTTFTSNDTELMLVSTTSPITGGVRLGLKPLASGSPTLSARIGGVQGPVVSRQVVDEFVMRTSAVRVIAIDEEFSDGALLGTANLIQTPLVTQLDVNMKAFVAGVLFTNGTNQLRVNTSQFSVNAESIYFTGSFEYQLIRNADVKHGFCHNFVVYQNGVQVSY